MPGRLHPDDVEAIARRVAELVRDTPPPAPAATGYLTVREYAELHGVARSTVYAHREELGCKSIGGAIRIPAQATPPGDGEPPPRPSSRQAGLSRRARSAQVDLLPIGRAS